MVRIAFWVALTAGAALAAGCGPGKELPEDIPKHGEQKDTEPPVPKESEPAARKYLAKAVGALTGGKPELLARTKVSRATFKGHVQLPSDSGGFVKFVATRNVAAVWPDRAHVAVDLAFEKTTGQVLTWLHRPKLVVRQNGAEFAIPNAAEAERVSACDIAAQYWLAIGPPLADPAAVAYGFKAQPDAPTFVRLAPAGLPPLSLYFDPKTDRLKRVEYVTTEQGRTRRKEWALLATQSDAKGVHLPHKFEFRQDGVLVEDWTAEKWEFPDSIPDAEFAPPPPKK
jgi:hypothetical protein